MERNQLSSASVREPFSEDIFREIYKYHHPKEDTTLRVIKNSLRCRKNTFFNFFPILDWLPKYKFKENVINDLIAGLTVTVMHIPHGLAYAPLGGQPPVVGLYMAIFPTVCYLILGTSRHISLGTFAVVCMMVGKVVADFAPSNDGLPVNSTDTDAIIEKGIYSASEVGIAICWMVGLWQFLFGFLHLGALWVLLSNSLVSGFTTGAALHVIIYQLKHLLGISPRAYSGPLKLIYYTIDVCRLITSANLITCGLSLCSIGFLLIFNELLRPYVQKKYPRCRVPIPTELFLIILGIATSYFLELNAKHNVRIVNSVPTGMPNLVIPPFSFMPSIVVDSLIIAIVSISMTLSLATIFARKGGYEIRENQEMIACGIGNIFSSFFLCIPSTASLSRSLVQFTVGGKSQIAGFFMVSTMLCILLFLGPVFEPVPYSVLAAVAVVSLKGLVFQLRDLPQVFKLSRLDGMVWLGTFLGVVVIDLDYGLGLGLLLSILTLVLRGQFPKIEVLGQVPNTHFFLDVQQYDVAQMFPDFLILKIYGNLHFANCNSLSNKIMALFDNFKRNNHQSLQESAKPLTTSYTLILDLSCVPSIDPTAVKCLSTLHSDLNADNLTLLLTDVNAHVYNNLEQCNFFEKFPRKNVIVSTFDALQYLSSR